MRVALIQMPVTADREGNLRTAAENLRRAAAGGADVAVLPEMFCCPYENRCFRPYGEEAGGTAQTMLSQTAAETGMYIVGGSIPELEGDRVYNTSLLGQDGSLWQNTARPTFVSTWAEASGSGSPTPLPRRCRHHLRDGIRHHGPLHLL